MFADSAVRAKLMPLARQDWKPEILSVGTRAAYVWCASGLLDGKVFQIVTKAAGDATTSRNWATILKLDAMVRTEPA